MMMQQDSASYNPAGFSSAGSTAEHEMDGGTAPSSSKGLPSPRQRFSQQQLLRHSIGGRASYVVGMRNSTAYTAPADAAGNAMPLAAAPSSPPPADGDGGYTGHDEDAVLGGATPPPRTPPQDAVLTAVGEDFVHEVLAMNTMAMEQCYAALGSGATPSVAVATEEPMKVLREAFMRLDDTSAQDLPGPLLDQLKATTLNNMGVVECNRGQPRQALSHFEAARQLEENNDMASPSVALNTCAAYNALRMYDKATAAALEAIDMLRALETQRQRGQRIAAAVARQNSPTATSRRGKGDGAAGEEAELSEALLLEAAAAPQIAESQNAALWGAAWNNLAVAQINTSREGASKDTSEYTNALTLFQNAMRATQELLGPQHPMSMAVVETYRSVRLALRNHGAFKQHRTLLRAPLPPVDPREQAWEEELVEAAPGQSRHKALVKHRQQLTITFRGEVTGGQKLVERVDGTPYPGAASEAYQSRRRGNGSSARTSSTKRHGKRTTSSKKEGNAALRGMPYSETLTRASVVYGNPHPLLYTPAPAQPWQSSDSALPPPPSSLPTSARGVHRDGERDNAAHTARTADGARPDRPSPPPPRPPRSQRDRHSTSSRLGARSSRASMLPAIATGRKADVLTMDDDEMNRTNGTTASSVFMHVPPPAPPRHEPPAAAAARLQHAKMLLLASPSSPGALGEEGSVGFRAAAGGSSLRASSHHGSSQAQGELNNSRGPLTPSSAHSGETDRVGGGASTTTDGKPAHELFQGMWVTADDHYVHRGPRVFGRPVYYTIATTLDVDEDGVSGSAQGRHDASSPGGKSPASDIAARPALPTLTYSGSSSGDDEDEGEGPRSVHISQPKTKEAPSQKAGGVAGTI